MNAKIEFQEKKNLRIAARNVAWLMREHDISQTDLSKITGISQTTISRLVSERSMPRVSSVQAIAKFFDSTMDDLLVEYSYATLVPYNYEAGGLVPEVNLDAVKPTGGLFRILDVLFALGRKKDHEKS